MGIVRSRDLQTGGLGISQLVGRCDGRRQQWMAGDSVGQWVDDPPHTHARAGVMRLGLEGCQPPINGLGMACPNRCQSQHESVLGAQESYEGSHGL